MFVVVAFTMFLICFELVACAVWDKGPNVLSYHSYFWCFLLSTRTTKYLFYALSPNSNITVLQRSDSAVCCFCWFLSVESSCVLWFFFFWWISCFLWYFIENYMRTGLKNFFFHRILVFASAGYLMVPLIQKAFSSLLALDFLHLTHNGPQYPHHG